MRTLLAAVMLVAALLGAAGPASAIKPTRGCPDGFELHTRDQILAMFPGSEEQFAFYDKNADSTLCGKWTPGTFNAIDNVAHH